MDSIDDNDVIVTRQWGPADAIPVTYKPGSKSATADGAVATYVIEAPGGGSFTNSTNMVIQSDDPNTVSSQIWVDDLSGLPSALTVTVPISILESCPILAESAEGSTKMLWQMGSMTLENRWE
ncbi:hypothetical protein Enr13x_21780 [Stieleria neptunia]|uniref:Uncharacterized protein n=1 Tax=Stieleria neptunia TaxID=2527979 RepID=A0A518HNB8_9BACT|nr:hypothetical protein [Stieleria neptunia]QDV42333.1 hypothetical protein Enr13x_21780 [Stieleria neptunia]